MSDTATETTSLTIELPREVVDRLVKLEDQATGNISDLLRDAITERVAYLEWKFAKIQEAEDNVAAGGRTYSDDEVRGLIESWEAAKGESRPS